MSDIPNIHEMVQAARVQFQERVGYSGAYTRQHNINLDALAAFNGGWGLDQIVKLDGGRFEFGVGTEAFILEAFGEDGETVIDLVSWPIDQPSNVKSMFGRVGLLGSWAALAPGTYFMAGTLTLHRTPLQWLAAGCEGAVIVTPSVAAQQLASAPGLITAQDNTHGREVVDLLKSVLHPERKVVTPSWPTKRNAA